MNNYTPKGEVYARWQNFRSLLQKYLPNAEGSFIFSNLNIFYFTGTFNTGIVWLPVEGEPILFCRRGAERAKLETPLKHIVEFTSYRDIPRLFNEFGLQLPATIAAELNGLTWALSNSLRKNLPGVEFMASDKLLAMTRAVKSEWELHIIRETGKKHSKCLTELVPAYLCEGISELEVAHKVSELFYSEGHLGMLRMENFGEEIFFGHVMIGESGNHPSVFNGPNGIKGPHPSVPYMGSKDVKWEKGSPLVIDNGFMTSGYHTDKTQTYWLGTKTSIPENVQRAYDFCIDIQNFAVEQLKPGILPSQIWEQCTKRAAQTPWAENFMGFGKNQVSFLGHGIGLAIDEYPVIAKGFDFPFEEGMTLAIEPKIGIPGVGMVGIEDTFEVTANGGKAITRGVQEMILV